MEFDKDLAARQEARLLCRQAKAAQKILSRMDQQKLDEIVEAIEAIKPNVRASFVVDTLTYLHRGGRCSGIAALAGGLLGAIGPECDPIEQSQFRVAEDTAFCHGNLLSKKGGGKITRRSRTERYRRAWPEQRCGRPP